MDIESVVDDIHPYAAGLAVACLYVLFVDLGRPAFAQIDAGIYANVVYHMVADGAWLVPHVNSLTGRWVATEGLYGPFLDKPPLLFWIQGLSASVLGFSEFAVRLPNAVYGTVTVLLVYRLGTRLYTRRAGLVAGLAYLTTAFVYAGWNATRSASTDAGLVVFGTAALAVVWDGVDDGMTRRRWAAVGGLLGLATMAKGLAAAPFVIVAGITLLAAGVRGDWNARIDPLAGAGAYAGVVLPWFVVVWAEYGSTFFETIVLDQVLLRALGETGLIYPDVTTPPVSVGGVTITMSFPYFDFLPIFMSPWFHLWLVGLAAVVGRDLLSPDRPGRRRATAFVALWMAVVLGIYVPLGNHGWYLMPLYPAAALVVGTLVDRAADGERVAVAGVAVGAIATLLFSFRFQDQPFHTLIRVPLGEWTVKLGHTFRNVRPEQGLRSHAIPMGAPLAAGLLGLCGAAVGWGRLDDRASDLPVRRLAAVGVVVFATLAAAPVGIQNHGWHDVQRPLSGDIRSLTDTDDTVYVHGVGKSHLRQGVTYTFYTERDLAPYEAAPSPEQADYVVYSPNKTPRWYPDPPDRLRAYENCSTYGSYGFNFTHANATADRRWVHLASKGGC